VKPTPTAIGTATAALIAGLEQVGYAAGLLARNYTFPDWFANQEPRTLAAAAFGRTPISYESSCIAVAHANGLRGQELVNSFRSFAAPILLEVDEEEVHEWGVSALENKHTLIGKYSVGNLQSAIATRAHEWAPENLLRTKNIAPSTAPRQRDLFAGLIPELEDRVQEKLDELLSDTLNSTRAAYIESAGKQPSPRALFKLVFWTLTAKVFRDRRVPGFAGLDGDQAAIFRAVAAHYSVQEAPPLNREARAVAAASVWTELDFRNLSVDVLANIWSRTLVDEQTRRALGIHRTPRSIVRYIVDRVMPFASSGDDTRIVFEPCSGSAALLIGALNFMRSQQPMGMASTIERHRFFVNHLSAMERESFGTEISRLALTLADFPHPNGWDINEADVFQPNAMKSRLQRASVVLCNPPFQRFTERERREYHPTFMRKPAELLHRVLTDIHPRGVLGFVLPYIAVDGREYAQTRKALAERFASLEITVLPERSFEGAPTDIALLIATEPIPHVASKLVFKKVQDTIDAWSAFQRDHSVSFEHSGDVDSVRAHDSLALPDLPEVWQYLEGHRRLKDFADIHIGLQWHAPFNERRYIRDNETRGFALGVPPNAKITMFKKPHLKYLNVELSHLRRPNVLQYPWGKPKVIVPKARQSRGNWRIAAYADRDGVVCNQAFQGVWPTSSQYDEVILAAILNGPIANAFVATHEGNRDVTGEVLDAIPMPRLGPGQQELLRDLLQRYENTLDALPIMDGPEDQEHLLKRIDAAVLEGYSLPPRLERQLLDFCSDGTRAVAHAFSRYFPQDFDLYVSLAQYMSPQFQNATIGRLLERFGAR
jgi:hypothetical protein